jgi:hypothetical protein
VATGVTFLKQTAPAAEGLFNLLNQYGWQKMRAWAERSKPETRGEFDQRHAEFEANDVAREVIAGSVLQLAFMGLKQHSSPWPKSSAALAFENGMNEIIAELPNPRVERFSLPAEWCVGRSVGNLPLGIVVYAGRNHYNHTDEKRLSTLNEVVFNHLHVLEPHPGNGLSLDLSDGKVHRAYSVLWVLGWTDRVSGVGYPKYLKDMSHALRVEI